MPGFGYFPGTPYSVLCVITTLTYKLVINDCIIHKETAVLIGLKKTLKALAIIFKELNILFETNTIEFQRIIIRNNTTKLV